MAQRQVGFDDERRRSSYSTPTFLQADTYRPGELRERGDRDNRDRGRGRDIDHDWRDEDSRDHRSDYRSPERRDGRQSDTTRDSNPKSKHLHSLETDASMLNAPLRPRDSASSSINRSPVVGRFGPTPSTHAPTKSTCRSFESLSVSAIGTYVLNPLLLSRSSNSEHLCGF